MGFSHAIYKAKEVGPQSTKEVGSRKKRGSNLGMQGDWYMGCKVTVLQVNWVGSKGWPCGFAQRY